MGEPVAELRAAHPGAVVAGCSTSGEILGTRVHDHSVVATAIAFEHSRVVAATGALDEVDGDYRIAITQTVNESDVR